MQTFLPHPDFEASARILDDRRLGKQRVEALQVLRALRRPGYGWQRHPVVEMWRGHDTALVRYGLAMCAEWRRRGHGDTVADSLLAELGRVAHVPSQAELAEARQLPPWLGDERLHASHRSALVRKDPARYEPLFPDDSRELPYVWPV